MKSADEKLEEALQRAVRCGYLRPPDVIETFLETVADEAGKEALPQWRARAELVLGAFTAEERRWTDITMNDRLDAAFASLERRGLIALQDAGQTASDAWEDIEDVRRVVKDRDGACFFHRQDVEACMAGAPLYLGHAAFGSNDPAEIGARICATLARYGIPAEWDGSANRRIRIPPFVWRKRRISLPPRPVQPRQGSQ